MGSKSTSVTEATTKTTNIGLSDVSGQTVGGMNNVVSFTDSGAVQAAVDMGNRNASFLEDTFSRALGFAEDSSVEALQFSRGALGESFDFGRESLDFGRESQVLTRDAQRDAYAFAGDYTEAQQDFSGGVIDKLSSAFQKQSSDLSSAYRSATGSFDMQKTLLTLAGIVAAGAVAWRIFK